MPEQQRITKSKSEEKQDVEEVAAPATSEDSQKLKDELDELLDEIDGVLETNAEEFIKNYILEGRRIDVAKPLRRHAALVGQSA